MATGVSRSSKSRGAVWILALSLGAPAHAGTLRVSVVDDHGQPVEHVAVYALPSKPLVVAADAPISIMDQARIEVLAGVNLPMLVKLASVRTRPIAEAVRMAQEAGRKYITVASRILAKEAS